MKVFVVTVFESGDFSTSVWGVFNSEKKAEEYKAELIKEDEENPCDGYYLVIEITEHNVI